MNRRLIMLKRDHVLSVFATVFWPAKPTIIIAVAIASNHLGINPGINNKKVNQHFNKIFLLL